jgi:Putative zincin peptidase
LPRHGGLLVAACTSPRTNTCNSLSIDRCKKIFIEYQLKTLSAICTADKFVAGKAPFIFVCLAPFVVINTALTLVIVLLDPGVFQILFCGALLLHIGAASGDIALVNLVHKLRSNTIWTYDDRESGISYFFKPSQTTQTSSART